MIIYYWKEKSRFVCYKHSIELALQGEEIKGEYVSEDDYYSEYNMTNYDCIVCKNAETTAKLGNKKRIKDWPEWKRSIDILADEPPSQFKKDPTNLKNVEINFLLESLEIVYDLALPNALDEEDITGDPHLLGEYRSQQNALDFVGLLIQDIKSLKEEQSNA